MKAYRNRGEREIAGARPAQTAPDVHVPIAGSLAGRAAAKLREAGIPVPDEVPVDFTRNLLSQVGFSLDEYGRIQTQDGTWLVERQVLGPFSGGLHLSNAFDWRQEYDKNTNSIVLVPYKQKASQ